MINDHKKTNKGSIQLEMNKGQIRSIILFGFSFIIPCMLLIFQTLTAQPSGGPYGPIRQAFELSSVGGKIYYVSPDGKTENSGETLTQPTTLNSAIERVKTDDAIILRGGIYRTGNLLLNQGITIQSYSDELPVIKGTLVANEWQNLGNGLWKTHWVHLFPSKPDDWWRRDTEGKRTPLYRFNNDMVFADGVFLQSAGWEGEVDESSYFIDYETGTVFIGSDPAKHVIEITAHNSAIRRVTGECHGKQSDHKGPVIRGITFTQFARCAIEVDGKEPEGISSETEHGKDVIGTTIEHCTISYCSRVAAYLRGDRLKIKHCKVSDTSTEGIYIIASSDVLLEKNIFTRNNIENITGYYPAAVKIFNQCYRVTCNDNFVTDLPNSNGIWYDVGNVDGVFINNWIEKVGKVDKDFPLNRLWPSDNGFFFEISKGVICAGNVFVDCDHGMMILNSSDGQIYQNTFVNSMACIGRTGRVAEGDHFGWHPSTGPAVEEREGHVFVNNLLTGDEEYFRPLLNVWQPPELCKRLSKPQFNNCDYNVYVRDSKQSTVPLVLWSPAKNNECQYLFKSIEELKKNFSEFSANSRYFTDWNNRLFKNPTLNNFQLLKEFPGASSGTQIPDEIIKLLRCQKNDARFVGAYPKE